ncbi:3-oxoacyl-[acyl-carrier-protein] synthase-3 [Saccharopolyspora antimicrobica]|uniref:3-oxoacyl-[acyl-carrier-protein] synthase-3 n=1 Tax=Saccharopolyspora antimicrobica TaxID=455193 RepID=A0A1I5C336_9PSEU|nr:ketoacyl-ACP synthase III family protein [Saccharopolyspora antimicrobica]RKT88987.1 3-oxoacyl-[acyl-carrier-protein] synthase-3 [Saccharopolyspora antimicrobica]SFN81388.1 3-oxoacyl-[acyl-carrier-protein] synthase-3 [Saccharopolyspora antimicrobica]
MRWNDLYIGATAMSLGREESTAEAVADGRYPAKENEAAGFLSVCVDPEGPTMDLAVRAAETALARAGEKAGQVGLVLHSSIFYQGIDDFSPAAYIQGRTVGGSGIAIEVAQASNGGMAALELAASYLTAQPQTSSVLITTADRFVPPGYDRYNTVGGMLFGDGGTAAVLCRGSGVARLLSSATTGDTTYGDVQLAGEPWSDVAGGNGWPLNVQSRVHSYAAEHGAEIFVDMVQAAARSELETMERALADADLEAGDIDWWVFPHNGLSLTDWDGRKAFGVDVSRTTWDWGRRCGHLGAGDQFAGLTHLLESKKVQPGDRVLVYGSGTGFMYCAAVLEIVAELPDATPQHEGGASR